MADKKISELDAITGAATAADDYFIVVDSSGAATKKISREELNNAIEQDVLSVVDINGGTIDGTTIGGSSAAAGTFTTLSATGNTTLGDAAGDVTQNKGGFAAQGTGLPASGSGVEINFGLVAGEGTVQAFDRSGSAWEQLRLRGNQVAVDISGSEKVRIDSTGNVGIGTTSPAQELHLVGKARIQRSTNANLEITSDNNTGASPFVVGTNSDTFFLKNQAASGFGTGGNFIEYAEGGSLRLMGADYIDSSGNVGINTTPSYRLHISNGSSTGTAMQLETTGSGHNFDMVDGTGTARFRNVNGEMNLYADLNTGGNGNIRFFPQGTTERMRITSSGNVGIGTSSPSVKLELNNGGAGSLVTFTDGVATNFNFSTSGSVGTFGTDAGSTSLALKTAGSERMRIDSSGNVGIGTTPSRKLEVLRSGVDDVNVAVIGGGSGAGGASVAIGASGTSSYIRGVNNGVGAYTPLNLGGSITAFEVSASEKMRIDSGGNVGIGTSSPSTKAEISTNNETSILRLTDTATIGAVDRKVGGIEFYQNDASGGAGIGSSIEAYHVNISGDTDLRFATGDNTERMRINSSGNVGISNTAPAGPLEVLDVNASGSSGEDGFLVLSTGQIQHSTDNTIAMYMNDSSSAAGTHNYIVFRYQGSTIGDIDTTDNSTIRYNTFTGAHWAQWSDHSQPDIPLGTVMSTINEMCNHTQFEYVDDQGQTQKVDIAGSFEIGSTHTIYIDEDGAQAEATATSHSTHKRLAKVKVSDTVGDKSVYGVFAGHYKDGDSSIESLGLGAIRIASGVTVENGDLLESAGDGTARPQTGDNADLFKASTIAKVTSTNVVETYDDGSFTVPCTLHCG